MSLQSCCFVCFACVCFLQHTQLVDRAVVLHTHTFSTGHALKQGPGVCPRGLQT
jgi:hypothetical protein